MKPKSVVFIPAFGTYGHVRPLFAIANILSRDAHVTVLTHEDYREFAFAAGIQLKTVGGQSSSELWQRMPELNRPALVRQYFRDFVLPFAKLEIEIGRAVLQSGPRCILAMDAPGIGARTLARETQSASCLLFSAPGFARSRSALKHLYLHELRSEIEALVGDAPGGLQRDLVDWWSQPAELLALWPHWFSDAHLAVPGLECVGFADPTTSREKASSAEQRNGVLITGGSAQVAGSDFFQVAVEACNLAGFPVTVVSAQNDPLPSNHSGKVTWVRKVECLQDAISAHEMAIHHGGMGTLIDCLRTRTPQVVLARGGDRPENGRCVERIGIGLNLKYATWNAATIAQAIKTKGFLKSAQSALENLPMSGAFDGVSRASAAVHRLLEEWRLP